MNNQKHKDRLIWGVLLSLTVACAYCLMMKICGIYPFGADTFLRVDMGMQYADFLSFVRNSSFLEKIYSLTLKEHLLKRNMVDCGNRDSLDHSIKLNKNI